MLPPFPKPTETLPGSPRVSIVVNNRNYASYLAAAVDSALEAGKDVDVVVVDDGSTDGSRALLEGYGGRVRIVLQETQGQKGAFNSGLAAAAGDIVIFLDADDLLDTGVADDVAAAFAANPTAARVVFRVRVVDAVGEPTGALVPSRHVALPHGDVRHRVLAFPDDLAWPPSSGNAFAAWALRRVMPLPLDDDRTGADSLLHPLVPLLGPVVALDRVGGAYRMHAANAHLRGELDIARSRTILRRAQSIHPMLDSLARELGYGGADPRSVTVAAHRMVSLRLGGAGHPVAGDTRMEALRAGLSAAGRRTDVAVPRRLAYALWFVAAAWAPRRAVRALAERSFQSMRSRRGSLLRRVTR
jgi:hypothetical protein